MFRVGEIKSMGTTLQNYITKLHYKTTLQNI